MTELETMQRAKMYLDKLAQGIDPITNEEVPADSALNNLRLARCFFYVSGVLGQVIDNGGVVGGKPEQKAFSITPEQQHKVQITQEPVRITQLLERIYAAVDNPQMKKPGSTKITNWLQEKGFLEKVTGGDGKSKRLPTRNGTQLGISARMVQGQYGEYQAVLYHASAQQFIVDNLPAILEEKESAHD